MKLRFLIPVFALLFLLSCGDDPISSDEFNDEDQQAIENDENVPHDDENSAGGNDSDSNTDTTHDDADSTNDSGDSQSGNDADNADSNDDTSDSQPENDSDNADSADDSDNNVPDNNDTTGDDDADTSDTANDTDEQEDQDNPETDEDSTTDTDSEQNDADQDSGSETEEELTVELPYNEDPVDLRVNLDTAIKKIDVLLMVELYSSMSAAHDNLKANVKTAIIDGIRAKIPDSAFGLVTLGVVEAGNAYNLAQPITTDPNLVRNAVDGITKITSGTRTYHGLALWEAASGEEDKEYLILCDNNAVCNAKYKTINISPVDCSGQIGNRGGACFRDNAMPVFVMASTQNFNNFLRKKNNGDSYDEWRESANGNTYTLEKTAVTAAAKMNEINAKFIGVSYKTNNPENGFKSVAGNTASQDTANPANNFNISVAADDDTFSVQIAEAVINLKENIKLEVKAEMKHVDNEYSVADTTSFVKSFYPTAVQTVKAGSAASFDVTFENKIHENNDCAPHIFYITVEAAGEGLVLDSRDIKIVVPGRECTESLK